MFRRKGEGNGFGEDDYRCYPERPFKLRSSKNYRNSRRKQDIINLGVLIKLVTSPCVEREHMG
jgi:hypothetical protein